MAFSFFSRMRHGTAAIAVHRRGGCIEHWVSLGDSGDLVVGWCDAEGVPSAELRLADGTSVDVAIGWFRRMTRDEISAGPGHADTEFACLTPGFVLYLPGPARRAEALVLRFGSLALETARALQGSAEDISEVLTRLRSLVDGPGAAGSFGSGLPPEIYAYLRGSSPSPAHRLRAGATPMLQPLNSALPWGTIDSWTTVTPRRGILVEGWCRATHPRVRVSAGEITHDAVPDWMLRYPRPDAAQALGLPVDEPLGFTLFVQVATTAAAGAQVLIQDEHGGRADRSFNPSDAGRPQQVLAAAWRGHAKHFLPYFGGTPPPEVLAAIALTAADPGEQAPCHVDHIFHVPGDRLLVDGWALDRPDSPLQIVMVDEHSGAWADLSTCWSRYERPDLQADGERMGDVASGTPGFLSLVEIPQAAADFGKHAPVAIYGVSGNGWVTVQRVRLGLPSTLQQRIETVMSRAMGSTQQSLHALAQNLGPSIESWLQDRAREQAPMRNEVFGRQVPAPRVSILVVLETSVDLARAQLARLALDPFIREACELIYVIDDHTLLAPGWASAQAWQLACGAPFRLLASTGDTGYAPALRMAAREARGDMLLLLDAGCLPDQPGWLPALVRVLDQDPDCGAAGPCLCSFDSAILSAGQTMGPHPLHAGLLDIIETARSPIMSPASLQSGPAAAVSGACLLTRRELFLAAGGLESGFLGRHHEAALYCMHLLNKGYHTRLLAGVRLHHLTMTRPLALAENVDTRSTIAIDASRIELYNAWRLDTRLRALGFAR